VDLVFLPCFIIFRLSGAGSKLLRRFVLKWSRRVAFIIGAIMGLSALGLNITPLIAAIGATGFVIGMALQNPLFNFASGLLIMTQRPFDVGDAIEGTGRYLVSLLPSASSAGVGGVLGFKRK